MGKIGDTNEIRGGNAPEDTDLYIEDYSEEYPEEYADGYAQDYAEDYVEDYVDYGDYYEEPRPARRRAPARGKKKGSPAKASRSKKAAPERSASGTGKRSRKSKRPNEDVLRRFGQKLLAVFIALLLIVIVIAVAFGDRIKQSIENHEEFNGRWLLSLLDPEKYSYGSDPADMKDYFKLFSDEKLEIDDPHKEENPDIDDTTLRMRQLLNSKLTDQGNLSVRAINCLKAADIETFADLVSHQKSELMKFRNFGKKSMTEIEALVEQKNLHFGMDISKFV